MKNEILNSCVGLWQPKLERSPIPTGLSEFDVAAVATEDSFTDRKSQSCAVGAVGQEGFKNLIPQFQRNSRTSIMNGQAYDLLVGSCLNPDSAAIGHGMSCI